MANNDRIGIGKQVYRYFIERGLAPHQAAAIAGNMAWEGGGKTSHVNPGDNWKNSPNSPHSAGIGQWNDRLPSLLSLARAQGIEIPEGDLRDPNYVRSAIANIPLKTQLDFAWGEMQGPERYAFGQISDAGDLRAATAGAIGYHRPAGYTRTNPYGGHAFDERQRLAGQILADVQGRPVEEIEAPSTSPDLAPMQTAAAPAQKENSKMFDIFSMLGKFAGMGAGAGAGGSAIPNVDALADPEQQNSLFGSLSAFGQGGKGSNGAGADGDLALQAMKQAQGGQSPQMQQMARKPFDMAQLQSILQRAGRLGTLPRGGGGMGGMGGGMA